MHATSCAQSKNPVNRWLVWDERLRNASVKRLNRWMGIMSPEDEETAITGLLEINRLFLREAEEAYLSVKANSTSPSGQTFARNFSRKTQRLARRWSASCDMVHWIWGGKWARWARHARRRAMRKDPSRVYLFDELFSGAPFLADIWWATHYGSPSPMNAGIPPSMLAGSRPGPAVFSNRVIRRLFGEAIKHWSETTCPSVVRAHPEIFYDHPVWEALFRERDKSMPVMSHIHPSWWPFLDVLFEMTLIKEEHKHLKLYKESEKRSASPAPGGIPALLLSSMPGDEGADLFRITRVPSMWQNGKSWITSMWTRFSMVMKRVGRVGTGKLWVTKGTHTARGAAGGSDIWGSADSYTLFMRRFFPVSHCLAIMESDTADLPKTADEVVLAGTIDVQTWKTLLLRDFGDARPRAAWWMPNWATHAGFHELGDNFGAALIEKSDSGIESRRIIDWLTYHVITGHLRLKDWPVKEHLRILEYLALHLRDCGRKCRAAEMNVDNNKDGGHVGGNSELEGKLDDTPSVAACQGGEEHIKHSSETISFDDLSSLHLQEQGLLQLFAWWLARFSEAVKRQDEAETFTGDGHLDADASTPLLSALACVPESLLGNVSGGCGKPKDGCRVRQTTGTPSTTAQGGSFYLWLKDLLCFFGSLPDVKSREAWLTRILFMTPDATLTSCMRQFLWITTHTTDELYGAGSARLNPGENADLLGLANLDVHALCLPDNTSKATRNGLEALWLAKLSCVWDDGEDPVKVEHKDSRPSAGHSNTWSPRKGQGALSSVSVVSLGAGIAVGVIDENPKHLEAFLEERFAHGWRPSGDAWSLAKIRDTNNLSYVQSGNVGMAIPLTMMTRPKVPSRIQEMITRQRLIRAQWEARYLRTAREDGDDAREAGAARSDVLVDSGTREPKYLPGKRAAAEHAHGRRLM